MGILYRYDYIMEGLSLPKVLSFRLAIEIPAQLSEQLAGQLDADTAPTSCFISQLYVKKSDTSCCLVITVNLLGLYAKWSAYPHELAYTDIIYYLHKKLSKRFGGELADSMLQHEKLDCDFIEYALIAEGKDVVRDMCECHAEGCQVSRLDWDDYDTVYREKLKRIRNEKGRYTDLSRTFEDFMTCIDGDYRHGDNEVYVRCYGPQLQTFFLGLEQVDAIAKRGVLLNYLYDDNLKRTLCQYSYEYNCLRRIPDPRKLYDEYCRESGSSRV